MQRGCYHCENYKTSCELLKIVLVVEQQATLVSNDDEVTHFFEQKRPFLPFKRTIHILEEFFFVNHNMAQRILLQRSLEISH